MWEPVLFGTWDGVFTTCMINIFGVVLFLRTGYLVVSITQPASLSSIYFSTMENKGINSECIDCVADEVSVLLSPTSCLIQLISIFSRIYQPSHTLPVFITAPSALPF